MMDEVVLDRLLKAKEVARITTLSVATIYRKMNAGTFPRPLLISQARVAWPESVIVAWMAKFTGENNQTVASKTQTYGHASDNVL